MAARCHVYDGIDFALCGGLLFEHAKYLYEKAKYAESDLPLSELNLAVRRWYGEGVFRQQKVLDDVYGQCLAAAQDALSGGTVAAAQAAAAIARANKAPPHFVQHAVRHAVTLAAQSPSAA